MAFTGTGKVWMNGKIVDWARRQHPHRLARHPLRVGVFEGARCYKTPKGSAVFRLDAHMRRLYDSAKIYRMEYALRLDALTDGGARHDPGQRPQGLLHPPARSTAATTSSASTPCPARWMRPSSSGSGAPTSVREALEKGVDVCVSSWTRAAPNTFPAMAKSAANYANSPAHQDGSDAQRLQRGHRARHVRLRQRGQRPEPLPGPRRRPLTPPLASAAILPGITRDSVITLAQDLGLEVREQDIPREALYIADELFFTGTAAEVTPIRSVDKIADRRRSPGPDHARPSSRRSSTTSTAWCRTRTAGSPPSTRRRARDTR